MISTHERQSVASLMVSAKSEHKKPLDSGLVELLHWEPVFYRKLADLYSCSFLPFLHVSESALALSM